LLARGAFTLCEICASRAGKGRTPTLIGLDCARETAEGLVKQANVLVQDSQEFREGRTSGFPAVMDHGIPNAGNTNKRPYLQLFLEQPGPA